MRRIIAPPEPVAVVSALPAQIQKQDAPTRSKSHVSLSSRPAVRGKYKGIDQAVVMPSSTGFMPGLDKVGMQFGSLAMQPLSPPALPAPAGTSTCSCTFNVPSYPSAVEYQLHSAASLTTAAPASAPVAAPAAAAAPTSERDGGLGKNAGFGHATFWGRRRGWKYWSCGGLR